MQQALLLSEDQDLLDYEPNLATVVPQDRYDWLDGHRLAAKEIERRLRARRVSGEPMELGRLGLRSKEQLRPVAAAFALHFLFQRADQGDAPDGYVERRWQFWLKRAVAMLEDNSLQLDYDEDNSGDINDREKNRPIPTLFIRG